jgi:hypothetical protein
LLQQVHLNDRIYPLVDVCRELTGLPPEARRVTVDSRTKLKRLLKANMATENPKMGVDAACEDRELHADAPRSLIASL